MNRSFVAYYSHDEETDTYYGIVPGIDGAHTYADTIEELQDMLKEVTELCLEEMNEEDKKYLPVREGTLQVEVTL